MKVIIIDNYDSFTFNLYQMMQPLVAEKIEVFRNDQIDFESLSQKKPDKIVLSPGPGHPAIASDFGVCKEIILGRKDLQAAILGVCLGHQGIVEHLGGKVDRAPQIVHGKMSEITIERQSPLFQGLPPRFMAMRYHSLVAKEDPFPPQLAVTAKSSADGLIMAIEHQERDDRLFGVQFHPESIGTPEGKRILENFVNRC